MSASPRTLGAAGVVGALGFLASVVVLQITTGVDPVDHLVGDFANGPCGAVFVVATIVHGAANPAIARGLGLAVGAGARSKWGVRLLVASAAGIVIAGTFPADPAGAPGTLSGRIHLAVVALSFASEWVALAALTSAFSASAGWRPVASLSRLLTVLGGVALAAFVAALALDRYAGATERASLIVFLTWELAIAVRLLRVR